VILNLLPPRLSSSPISAPPGSLPKDKNPFKEPKQENKLSKKYSKADIVLPNTTKHSLPRLVFLQALEDKRGYCDLRF
jgi:hypothetical protein